MKSLEKLTRAEWNFEDMAKIVSNCAETRAEGGNIGWVNLAESFDASSIDAQVEGEKKKNPNEHLNEILPPLARQQIFSQTTKPGDIISVESHRGVHLIQVVDVMVDVRKLSFVKARNNKNKDYLVGGSGEISPDEWKKGGKLAGLLGGALFDDNSGDQRKELDLTYKIETMGCQMNSADSERIEGQLMSLGIRPLMDDEYMEIEGVKFNDGLMAERKKVKREKKKPDVIVLNTCSIRDHAEQKVYS